MGLVSWPTPFPGLGAPNAMSRIRRPLRPGLLTDAPCGAETGGAATIEQVTEWDGGGRSPTEQAGPELRTKPAAAEYVEALWAFAESPGTYPNGPKIGSNGM